MESAILFTNRLLLYNGTPLEQLSVDQVYTYLTTTYIKTLFDYLVPQGALNEAGVKIYGGERAAKSLGLAPASEPKHEYGTKEITLEIVDSMEQAIDHIHEFGSGHTEAIVTGQHFTTSSLLFVLKYKIYCTVLGLSQFVKLTSLQNGNIEH